MTHVHRHVSRVLPALLLAAIGARPAPAQTADAGTPVVGVHSGDEILPALVPDGQGGAFVGFQTVSLTGQLTHGVIHIARLLPNATPDPTWVPSTSPSAWVIYNQPSLIAPAGRNFVWGIGDFGTTLMWRAEPDGAPSVVVTRSQFQDTEMQAVPQPGGDVLVLHAPIGEGALKVDRVDAGGGLSETSLTSPLLSTAVGFSVVASARNTGDVIAVVGGYDPAPNLQAVKVNADGSAAWSPASRAITWVSGETNAAATSDGADGAYIVWTDNRSTTTRPDVYAMHLLADGSLAAGWPANGKAIAAFPGTQQDPSVVADASGGAWFVWTDARSGPLQIYFTHLKSDGTPATGFTTSGRALSAAAGAQVQARAETDRAGGMFVVWRDGRAGGQFDVYAQHVMPDGTLAGGLASDGEPVCTNAADEADLALADVDANAAIVAWRDNRSGGAIVYAARVPAGGASLGVPGARPGGFALARAGANPARGAIECAVTAAARGDVTVRLIDAAGRVIDARSLSAGVTGAAVRFSPARPGLYFLVASQGSVTRTSRVAFVR